MSALTRSTSADSDPRPARHAQNKAKIIKEAWKLAAHNGIAGLSMGELAKRVGLRQPSLYTYFESKNDLYSEMFADGNRQLLKDVAGIAYPDDPREALKEFVRACTRFSSANPARHSLLFQRPVPDFEPSPDAFNVAREFYDRVRELLARAGVTRQEDLDVFASLTQGLSDQQVANEPGGERWATLVDDVIDTYLDRIDAGGFRRRRRKS